MVAVETEEKETISIIIATVAKRKIYFILKTRIFYIRTTTDKIELTGKVQGNKKMLQSRKGTFSVKESKSLKKNNFVLKIETG